MINNVNKGVRSPVDQSPVQNRGKVKPTEAVERDSVKPTSKAALSGAISHMVKQGMPIDLDRVVAVRNAIADGAYPVDPMKIAEKILEFDNPGEKNS